MTCTNFYTGACPEVVPVTVNQTVLTLDGVDAEVIVEHHATVTLTAGVALSLAAVSIAGYSVKVWVNGVLQRGGGVDFSHTSGTDEITFTTNLTADEVQIEYAKEV